MNSMVISFPAVAAVVHRHVGAERQREVGLGPVAGRGHHQAGAQVPRQLHQIAAHGTGGGRHQHRVTRLQVRRFLEQQHGGTAGNDQRAGLVGT
jgi:hypothetical protein